MNRPVVLHDGSERLCRSGGARWKQPERDQLLAQSRGCREMDRVDAEGTRGGDVRLDIVDVDGAVRLDRKPLY